MRFSRNEHKKLTGHVYFRGRPRLTLNHKIHESLSRLSVKSTVHHTLVLALTNCKQQRSPSYLVLEAGEFSMLALLTILLLRETIN